MQVVYLGAYNVYREKRESTLKNIWHSKNNINPYRPCVPDEGHHTFTFLAGNHLVNYAISHDI